MTTESRAEDGLVEAAMHGDKKAFSRLYVRHQGQVQAFCTRMLQGRPDVEDAVQQVFLEAWRSLYRFEGRSLFSTWLTKIAIHTCLSFHRKASRIVLAIDDEQNPIEQSTELVWGQENPMPDEQVIARARKNAVFRILRRMTPKKKQVFVMSDMQGMTAPEISGVLGIPDATVRTRLFHARREFALSVRRNPFYRDLLTRHVEKARRTA